MTAETRPWFYLAVGAAFVALVFVLKPILSPFAMAALLAYIGDPLVDWLERCRLTRTLAVTVVFCILFILLVTLAFFLIPKLEQQVAALVHQLPKYLTWVQGNLIPHLAESFDLDPEAFGVEAIRALVVEHWQRAGGFAVIMLSDLTRSGAAIASWLANLVLVPVVTFYLLRDWDGLVGKVHALLPRNIAPTIDVVAKECDAVLGEFFRGQLLVMLALAIFYWLGLWLVGLELALLIGLTAGLVSFVPYLGFIVGIIAALVAAFFQFDALWPLFSVGVVFGIGQLLEGMLLTPWLVGDRIGLHPVAVIFAVLAGGQLFGLFGVLLALPIAAVIVVILRHLHDRYVESELYDAE